MSERIAKQMIVIRRDLGMRRGKEIVQGSHASLWAFSEAQKKGGKAFDHWWTGPSNHKKVCVRVESEEELRAVYKKALDAGLIASFVVDAGLTEFHGIPTPTAVAIGPDWDERIDPITSELKLL